MSSQPDAAARGWCIELVVAGPDTALAAFEAALDDPAETTAVSLSRGGRAGTWTLRAIRATRPDESELRFRLAVAAAAAGREAPSVSVAPLPAVDWVAEANRRTPPVSAGRFYVRGTHVTRPPPPGSVEIVLDAGPAFGSGAHESTRGCLLALDRVPVPAGGAVLDLGTGSGILAIAAAKLWKRPVLAADIDPVSVETARENAVRNGVGALVEPRRSRGFSNPRLPRRAPYGLIIANILAEPLVALAPRFARYLGDDGLAILSGFLDEQEERVAGACAASGLTVRERVALDGWRTLVVGRARSAIVADAAGGRIGRSGRRRARGWSMAAGTDHPEPAADNDPREPISPEAEAFLRGIAAAPEPVDPAEWVALIAPSPDPGDVALWSARAAARRADGDGGLGRSPAPPGRLAALRRELAHRGLDGFVVPLADEHQGEFVPPRARRLAWLTGFTGSAGIAVVLADKAAIFVDGRYTLQVETEVDQTQFSPMPLAEQPPDEWIAANLGGGAALGYDPWLHTADGAARLEAACAKAGGRLVALDSNPVDALWTNQPARPISPAVPHPPEFAGLASSAKRAAVCETLANDGVDAAVLSAPDSIAWLFNMRGGDIPNTPVALAFAIVETAGRASLFIDRRKMTERLAAALSDDGVAVAAPDALGAALDGLAADGRKVRVDPRAAPAWIARRLRSAGAEPVHGPDPCALPKACKNPAEIAGARAAHIRDGRALVRFLAWLDAAAPAGGVTEIDAADRLRAFRADGAHFRGLSFETIAGAGPNGAIVHYRVNEASNRRLEPGSIFLLDSGAQYLDGTTDVTRTVHIRDPDGGPPAAEIRDRFTRVLKGHIALAAAVFPRGTAGDQLDALARRALWEAGLDYDHGTGHGVGSFLGVHEGPARISKGSSGAALAPGMILSNEPGYYKPGSYGIRIENLVTVVEAEPPEGAERTLYAFDTLTLAPIDRSLIEPARLTPAETAWLDAYHQRVLEAHAGSVDEETGRWLDCACAPLTRR